MIGADPVSYRDEYKTGDDDVSAKTFTQATHGHVCPCADCVLNRELRDSQTRVVHESPSSSLPSQSVSTLEVLQDWQLRELRKTLDHEFDYEVGEDWNDD